MGSYLFAMPSFWSGVGRAVDLAGKFDDYNYQATPEEADAIAAWWDWYATGSDLANAAQDAVSERQEERAARIAREV